jgi:hypothetical protein
MAIVKKKYKALYIPASIRISHLTPRTKRAMRVYAAGPIQEGIKKTKRKVYYCDAEPIAVGFLEGLSVNQRSASREGCGGN